MESDGKLSMWTVYDHPRDFPNNYVARRFEIGGGGSGPKITTDLMVGFDLEQMRGYLRSLGLTVIPRSEGDDPVIVECWI